jgi:hypothetical protein
MNRCPDCEIQEQKERNYELAKKMVDLHKTNVIFYKDNHGKYRASTEGSYDPASGTILKVLRYKRPTTKKL